jgi:hypothetical protein
MVLAMIAVAPDLDHSNVARVHAPAALVAAMLAAAGIARLAALRRGAWLGGAAAAALLASAIPTAAVHFARTNEAMEETFLRHAAARLSSEQGYDLVFIQNDDRRRDGADARYTHDHVPLYLFPGARPRGIDDYLARPDPDRPAYALFGMRCFARFRPWGTAAPAGENLQPACARLRAGARLAPVLEHAAVNEGDRAIAYYGDAPVLPIGLYRVFSTPSRGAE